MKKNTLLLFSLLFAITCLLLSNASGPGNVQNTDRTGGPLSPGSCDISGCHGGGDFGTAVQLTLVDEAGDTIREYVPEAAYTLKVAISASGAEGYGFQAVAIVDADSTGAGAFGTPPAGMQITDLNGIGYAEQSTRASSSNFEIDWTAPAEGTGSVSFYAAGNAVNANGSTSGDDSEITSTTLSEAIVSSLHDIVQFELQLAPNPAAKFIRIEWSQKQARPEELRIISTSGQSFYARNVANVSSSLEIPLENYPAGIYLVQISSADGIQTEKFLKY